MATSGISENVSMAGAADAGQAQARAQIFAFLAEILSSPPTEQTLSALGAIAREFGIACDTAYSLSDIGQEFMDLFVLPNPRYVAPYESAFRDEWPLPAVLPRGSNPSESGTKIKGLLMGESTIQVRNWYLRAGVLPEKDLPDHVANELRFLAWIAAKRAGAGPAEARLLEESETSFCREHLLKWIGRLRERVAERDRFGYYYAALRVAECLAEERAEYQGGDPRAGDSEASRPQRGGEQRETRVAGRRCPFSESVPASLGGVRGTRCPV